MNKEAKIIAGSAVGTAIALILLGAFFMQTGSKLAGYALLASPILIIVGTLIMKRGVVSMNQYGLPLQLKAREFAEFIETYNDLESRLASSAKLLGAPRESLPSLWPLRTELAPYLRVSEHPDQPLESNPRRHDDLDLALLHRQRAKLGTLREQADTVIRQATGALRAAAASIARDLERMGWGKPLPPPTGEDAKDALQTLHATLQEMARGANDGLQQAIRSVESEYKESASAAALREQALQAMDSGNVLGALVHLRDAGRLLEGRLKDGFDRGRTELMRALLELSEAPGRLLLARATQDRIQALHDTVEALHSPLQVGLIPQARAQIVETAGLALAELEEQVSRQGALAWGSYLERFGGRAEPAPPEAHIGEALAAWRPRF
ncbi:MAG: hypothetical protein LC623_09550, partial [Halobacteriales archaeon]|nr:hypothetical protein [Halobacteriales archaeon]